MARAMKDSGIDWLGDIPADWSVAKAKYFFDIQLGKMLQPEPDSADDTLEYYLCAANLGGNNLKTDSLKQMWLSPIDKAKFDVRKGDLLVVEGGDVASCDIVTEDVQNLYIQNALHRVRSKNGCDVRFLRYILIIAKTCGYIDLICNKATIAHFTKDKFASMSYPVLPLDEQQRIAAFLDGECARIDSVVEKTRASIEEYRKLKQAIITRAVTKGIRPNRTLKHSGIEWLGDIPDDWNIVQLKRLAKIQTGNTPSKTENDKYYSQESGYLWIKPEDLGNITPITSTTEYLTEDGIKYGRLLPPNTVYVCCIASVGKVGFCNSPASCNQQINGLIFHNVHWKYGFYVTIAQESEYINNASGNVMKIINSDKQSRLMCPLPPIDEQREIAAYLDEKTSAIDSLVAKKNRLVSELASLKKSLIFEYVTGKKEVPK